MGLGYEPFFVDGSDPEPMHQAMARTLDTVFERIATIQRRARSENDPHDARWPMIVLRSPKGWTGPKTVDGKPAEASFRSHQVPLAGLAKNAEHFRQLEAWLRSYRPEELFTDDGALRSELADLAPRGNRRMGANPHANGGRLTRDLVCPDFRAYAVDVPAPGAVDGEATRVLGGYLRDIMARNESAKNFRVFGPDETSSNRLDALFEVTDRVSTGRDSPDRRARLAGWASDGSAERASVPGLARGLPAHGPTRILLLLRGVHSHRRLDVQSARQVAEDDTRHSVACAGAVAQLSAHVARLAAGPQRIQPPGPRVHRSRR